MADVAAQIDDFLQRQGSPLAGLGNVFAAAGSKYGVDPRLVVAISGAESSFGKHNFGSNNAWGWGPGHEFGSFQEGISAVTKGLASGYISQGLKTPAAISRKWAPVGADNDPHGLNQNWTDNVSHFYEQLGGAPGASVGTARASAFPTAPPSRKLAAFDPSPIIESGFNFSPQYNVRRLVDAMIASDSRPQPQAAAGHIPVAGDVLQPPGRKGQVTVAPSANRQGMALHPQVVDFVERIAGRYGRPLEIGTGTNHNQYVAGTNRQSAHWTGWAADVPASGNALTRLGRSALITAGMPAAKARRVDGGLFNIGGYQIIFNSMEGGNHFNHLHVGLRGAHQG